VGQAPKSSVTVFQTSMYTVVVTQTGSGLRAASLAGMARERPNKAATKSEERMMVGSRISVE
jgi:hypothetical protein